MSRPSYFSLCFSLFLLLSCQQGVTQESGSASTEGVQANESVARLMKTSMKGVEEIKYHDFIDKENGLVQLRYPIPVSWTVNSTESPVYIEATSGMQVYQAQTSRFGWSNDPMMQQTIQMTGYEVAPPMDNQSILQQMIQPMATSQGYKMLTSYDLPEVAGLWQRLFHAMPNTGTQRVVEATGTEWTTRNGTKALIVIVRTQFVQNQAVMWSVQTTEMEAAPAVFEKEKNAYFYALANAKLNPQWVQYKNGQLAGNIRRNNEFWAQASAQSAAAHQQRMQAISDRGNAARSLGETYSDILDISHKGYLNRSNINDAGHSKTIRGISETTLIGNHETGEHYEVPAGSRYYWISNDGVYLGTDNPLLDPNVDGRLNEQDWTKFAVEF